MNSISAVNGIDPGVMIFLVLLHYLPYIVKSLSIQETIDEKNTREESDLPLDGTSLSTPSVSVWISAKGLVVHKLLMPCHTPPC